jgi:hypothetical protein
VAQRFEEQDAVIDIDQAIIRGMENQCGWRLPGHVQFVGEKANPGIRWVGAQERLA